MVAQGPRFPRRSARPSGARRLPGKHAHTLLSCVAVACVRAYVCVCLHRCVRAWACVHVSACMRAHALACMRRFFPVKEEARLETRRVRMREVMRGTKEWESGGGWAGGWVRAGRGGVRVCIGCMNACACMPVDRRTNVAALSKPHPCARFLRLGAHVLVARATTLLALRSRW